MLWTVFPFLLLVDLVEDRNCFARPGSCQQRVQCKLLALAPQGSCWGSVIAEEAWSQESVSPRGAFASSRGMGQCGLFVLVPAHLCARAESY